MPSLRTELTEIVTGLGMLGVESLDTALLTGPAEILNVTAENFDRLARAREAGKHGRLFSSAWNNGEMFASSSEGLRNRKPLRVALHDSLPAPSPRPAARMDSPSPCVQSFRCDHRTARSAWHQARGQRPEARGQRHAARGQTHFYVASGQSSPGY